MNTVIQTPLKPVVGVGVDSVHINRQSSRRPKRLSREHGMRKAITRRFSVVGSA
ncbi:hypothetical protein SAMN05446635_6426 [Burkholderia sp. OK233]|nr:hypothetical protein SAMN05446635_6426 [Burkholderia sp. OK233]